MNRFEYMRDIDDMGITPVENAFLNHYMPKARGDYVKVYLYGLKCCFQNLGEFPSNSEIAVELMMEEADVMKAWKYWQEQHIIALVEEGGDLIIDFFGISSMLFVQGGKPPKPRKTKKTAGLKAKQMFAEIEDKIGRLLTHNEMDAILSWMEDYKFTFQTVVLLIEDCVKRDKRGFSYWESMAGVYHEMGIETFDQAQQYIAGRDSRWREYNDILHYLGFYRMPSQTEKQMMNKWLDEYAFDMEKIKQACDETAAVDKPSFKYVDSVLTAWHTGVAPEKPPRSSPAKNKKTRIQDAHNYDDEMLDKILFGEER